jgi:hypothetical protein
VSIKLTIGIFKLCLWVNALGLNPPRRVYGAKSILAYNFCPIVSKVYF